MFADICFNLNTKVIKGPFVNLGIGTSALELELDLELELKLIQQTPLFPVPLGLWTPNLAGWWFRMRGPTHKVTWHVNQMVTWQIKNVISLLSQSLWTPNLAGWWLWMRGLHPQSHVKYRPRGHVTNQKRYISTFTRPMDHTLNKVVT